MYFGAPFLIPLTFGIFFTTLILPLSNFFEKKLNFGRFTSSFLSTLILFIVMGGIFFLLFMQLTMFLNDLLDKKADVFLFIDNIQQQVADYTGYTLEQQEEMLKDRLSGWIEEAQLYLSSIISDFSDVLVSFLLMLIYVLLMLINRDKFLKFIMKYVPEEKQDNTRSILEEMKTVANRYLWGRVKVMTVLAIMYTITFLAYDLEYSALLILFGVLVTIIPYIGPFLSGLFPIIFMLIMSDSTPEIVSFTILVLVIQLIESYVLEPLIIGSEVRQSPMFVIIAIVLGSVIWGVSGLILFVPLFGVIKIIFDNTQGLEPLGYLIGYDSSGVKDSLFDRLRNKLIGIKKD